MAYMNAELLEDTKRLYKETLVIDLVNRHDDRTLTLGSDATLGSGENIMRHVYLEDGKLHLHVYMTDANGWFTTIDYLVDNEIGASYLNPREYVIPRATDTDFVMSMYRVGIKLNFIPFRYEENNVFPISASFYGHRVEDSDGSVAPN